VKDATATLTAQAQLSVSLSAVRLGCFYFSLRYLFVAMSVMASEVVKFSLFFKHLHLIPVFYSHSRTRRAQLVFLRQRLKVHEHFTTEQFELVGLGDRQHYGGRLS
jgi:hypothetical protein